MTGPLSTSIILVTSRFADLVCLYLTVMKYMYFHKLILVTLHVETWKLYGDAIWWPLCTPFDVTFFNLLWADLQ